MSTKISAQNEEQSKKWYVCRTSWTHSKSKFQLLFLTPINVFKGNREIQKIVDEFKKEMEKENQTIEDLKDKKVELNSQFEVRRAAVQAKEWFNQLIDFFCPVG